MNFKGDNFVRFKDWIADRSSSPEKGFRRIGRPSVKAVLKSVRRGFGEGSESIGPFKVPVNFRSDKEPARPQKKVFNPQGSFLQSWNKAFLLSCVIALALDPLFFYIPVVDGERHCLNFDRKLEIVACVLRTFIDTFYIVHIAFEFRTAFIAPSSRVFGRGELIEDTRVIAQRYLSSYFIIDILAILPLPQIGVLVVIPNVHSPVALVTKDYLKVVIFSQYVPRIVRICPLYREVTRTSGIVTETAWAGAALNLFLYTLASHMFGAFWYLFSVERQDTCWREECSKKKEECEIQRLYCGKGRETNNSFLNSSCPFVNPDKITNSTVFNFGIFIDALESRIVESWYFPRKFCYCFWWGLRNLSSLGQELNTSKFVGEIIFAICICIAGLVLFALLIGNMQKYLESTTLRLEEMRVKRGDTERWMSHRMLPENLRERIRRYDQYKWQVTRGVEEETLLRNLPKDLRRDIKRHLCLDLLKRVPMFEILDEQLLDALSDRLKPALYTEDSYILREGDPVEEMLFVMRGHLMSATTNGGRTGFFNAVYLKAGDFCGDDLLTWALDPKSSSHFPISTRTVQALSEVEGFALVAEDLKFVASQFRRLHNKKLQHTFRFHSVQWKTWAACFIQAAWRRYCRKKMAKALHEEEDRLRKKFGQEPAGSLSLGATLYASRFASNALRNLRQNPLHCPRLPLLPQKPAEPDFSSADS